MDPSSWSLFHRGLLDIWLSYVFEFGLSLGNANVEMIDYLQPHPLKYIWQWNHILSAYTQLPTLYSINHWHWPVDSKNMGKWESKAANFLEQKLKNVAAWCLLVFPFFNRLNRVCFIISVNPTSSRLSPDLTMSMLCWIDISSRIMPPIRPSCGICSLSASTYLQLKISGWNPGCWSTEFLYRISTVEKVG